MQNTPQISTKYIFSSLTKPLKIALSIIASITGLNFFGIIIFVAWIVNEPDMFIDNPSWRLFFVIALIIIFVGLLIITVFSLYALIKVKVETDIIVDATNRIVDNAAQVANQLLPILSCLPDEEIVKSATDNMIKAAGKLNTSLQSNKLSNYILQSAQIAELEGSVRGGFSIIVLTSKFQLDSGSFINIIMNNIKKGVTYKYLVPNESYMRNTFDDVCRAWWSKFWEEIKEFGDRYRSQSINRKKIEEQFPEASKKYIDILLSTVNNSEFDTVKISAKKFFCDRMHGYLINQEHSLVTIIMYENKRNRWDVIMKLSTEEEDNEYYAYKIPDEEDVEKAHLVRQISNFCDPNQEIPICIDD